MVVTGMLVHTRQFILTTPLFRLKKVKVKLKKNQKPRNSVVIKAYRAWIPEANQGVIKAVTKNRARTQPALLTAYIWAEKQPFYLGFAQRLALTIHVVASKLNDPGELAMQSRPTITKVIITE